MSTISPFIGRSVVVRTQSAGVFYGTLTLMAGDECILADARRVWYWAGAASLSQLAVEGTKCPGECKFPRKVEAIHLLGVVEVLPLTREAYTSLEEVEVWSA